MKKKDPLFLAKRLLEVLSTQTNALSVYPILNVWVVLLIVRNALPSEADRLDPPPIPDELIHKLREYKNSYDHRLLAIFYLIRLHNWNDIPAWKNLPEAARHPEFQELLRIPFEQIDDEPEETRSSSRDVTPSDQGVTDESIDVLEELPDISEASESLELEPISLDQTPDEPRQSSHATEEQILSEPETRDDSMEVGGNLPNVADEAETQEPLQIAPQSAIDGYRTAGTTKILKSTSRHEEIDCEAFTSLDALLVANIKASASGIDGALSRERIEELISEFLVLNESRDHSFYHKGYADALFGKKLDSTIPGTNANRRGWLLTGYLKGRLREPNDGSVTQFIDSNRAFWKELLDAGPTSARTTLLSAIVSELANADAFQHLRDLFDASELPRDSVSAINICNICYEKGAQLIREGRHAEARPLLSSLLKTVEGNPALEDTFKSRMMAQCWRKLGQSELRDGRFPAAEKLLKMAIDTPHFQDRGSAQADLGLAKARLRSLRFALPKFKQKESEYDSTVATLESAKEHFIVASKMKGATNAHLVLGLIALHRRSAGDAETHLSQAYAGMLENHTAYQTERFVDWVRFLLSIAVAESCQPASLNELRSHLEHTVACPVSFPQFLWKRLFSAAEVYGDDSLLTIIIDCIYKNREYDAFELLHESDWMRLNPIYRQRYFEWLQTRNLPWDKLAGEYGELLSAALESEAIEEASEVLDVLEGLVKSDSGLVEWFITFLHEHRSRLLSIWDEVDFGLCVAGLYAQAGNSKECAEVLQGIFWVANKRNDSDLMGVVLDQLRVLAHPEIDIPELRRHALPQVGEIFETGDSDISKLNARVLYVGGNEMAARYETHIRSHFEDHAPQLVVEFYYPGFDSSWNVHLDKVRSMLPQFDVVVINNWVRTGFGKKLRGACGTGGNPPWRACTTLGKQKICNSIQEAAVWVMKKEELDRGAR